MFSSLISTTSVITSLLTLSGVFLHDTRLDKATVIAATPVQAQYATAPKPMLQSDAHTHVERNSFSQAMRVYQTSTPGIQPRNDERKHLMQRNVPKGHHPFDNYNLPIA